MIVFVVFSTYVSILFFLDLFQIPRNKIKATFDNEHAFHRTEDDEDEACKGLQWKAIISRTL